MNRQNVSAGQDVRARQNVTAKQRKAGSIRALEERITRALRRQAESIQVTSEDEERMRCSVHRRIEEESGMKKWSARKIAVVAAAVCVLGSITAVAAGKAAYTTGTSSHMNDFNYSQLGDMETKLGFATKAPETFSNGYRFDVGTPTHDQAVDAEGNIMKTAESLSLHYTKGDMADIFISVRNTSFYNESGRFDQTFDHNGVTVGYNSDQYLFVPPDYQVTEEEKAREAAGELYISYGSEEVENKVTESLSWEEGENYYVMTTFDNSMTAQELAQMAGEIIDNR